MFSDQDASKLCGVQVIVNLTRAPFRALSLTVPIRLQDFNKIEEITSEVRNLLDSHPKAYLGEDKPRCSVSRFGAMSIDIAITCNFKAMVCMKLHFSLLGYLSGFRFVSNNFSP
jgi:small-conductance mechanosensitive channel